MHAYILYSLMKIYEYHTCIVIFVSTLFALEFTFVFSFLKQFQKYVELAKFYCRFDVTQLLLKEQDPPNAQSPSYLPVRLCIRGHSGYGFNQRETALQDNVVSHWLSPYTE